ncbi:phage tail tape measure protein [Zunongwangia sp. F260]|uniref:Phage tail tape measure protein n=1 Tax=Autumnicola lenta TaxID=3075593 RepID=A0ABU3CM94_9FLAO|nr:phage tail tape measure protein [Zunongwangia sp. F260]MDT0647475.1 phage tail tape measure protein [Zunongwangia sp. F260]
MASTIKVPTVFTAVDKMTAVIRGMTNNVSKFSRNSISHIQRFDQKINSTFNKLGRFTQIGLGVGLAGIFTMAGQANLDYEKSLASVSAITGATGKDLAHLERISMDTAKATYKAGAEVLKAYELIGSAKPDLLQNADALDAVTRSAITLSKASGMDLTSSAEALTDVMNQFNIDASKSNEIIDKLAAGSKYGSAAIPLIKDAILGFGASAKAANVNVSESVALVEVLASKGIKGAESGTKLRNVLTKMSTIQALPPEAIKQLDKFGVNTALVADKTVPFIDRLKELSKIAEDPLAMVKMFGTENKDAAQILLQNLPVYDDLISKIGESGVAYEQAAKNSSTMAYWINSVKNRFLDSVTATQSNNSALEGTKTIMKFVADNMESIVGVGISLIGVFAVMKALTWGVQAATFAYNIVIGVSTALQKKNILALRGNAVALKAYAGAQWLVNAATAANPIGAVILAIVALVAIVAVAIAYYDEWGAMLLMLLGPFGFLINLIQSFRKHWDSIKEAFKDGGIVGGLKRIGAVIIDALLVPMEQFIGLIGKIPGVGDMVAPALKFIENMRANLNLDANDPTDTDSSADSPNGKPEFIPSSQQQHNTTQETIMEKIGKGQMEIFLNDPGNMVKDVKQSDNFGFPSLTTTQGQR